MGLVIQYKILIIRALLIFSLIPTAAINAQRNEADIKFLFGLKGGINASHTSILQRFALFNFTNEENDPEKNYYPFYKNLGYQYGFIGQYNVSNKLGIIITPTISKYKVGYSNEYIWTSRSNPDNSFELLTDNIQHIRYFEIPVLVKYAYSSNYPHPYVQGGAFYSLRQDAFKESSSVERTINVAGEFESNSSSQSVQFNESITATRLALIAGVGYEYLWKGLIFFGEVNYQYGLHNIMNESGRYSNQYDLGNNYDTTDDIKLHNIVVNIGILFSFKKSKLDGTFLCP